MGYGRLRPGEIDLGKDETIIYLSSLLYLANSTKILVKIEGSNSNPKTYRARGIFSLCSFPFTLNVLVLEILPFSDNSNKLSVVDLSSASTSADTDVDNEIHYISSVPSSGSTKMTDAQMKKIKKDNRIICNRKIFYFFHKYANIHQSNYH